MIRKLIVLLCLALVVAAWGFAAQPSAVSVMTQNMDAGTDLTYAVLGILGAYGLDVPSGVDLTYQEVLASRLPDRAALLARYIAEKKPDLLTLQEATLWRTGASVDTATTVLADQLQLLLAGLADRGVPYDIVAVNNLADVALPKTSGGVLRITDRDALLIRSDLRPPALHLSDVHANTFDAAYSLNGVQIPSGWISAMVHSGNRHFRLATTHLQGPVGNDPAAIAVQTEQAAQLIHEFRNSPDPVVLAGDFNSDAIPGTRPGPDNTGTAAFIVAAGYTDIGTGIQPTWPLYLEDLFPPPPFFGLTRPWERIDLIFSKWLAAVSVERVIAPGNTARLPNFGSDHAGVFAVFQP